MLKKIFKKIGIGLTILLGVIVLFLLALAIVHRILLAAEREKIIPNGQLVEVNRHLMHVYIKGDNKNAPFLIFLSGSGTSAPVYDFKPLYSLLSDDYRIAVVEKAGYGYSEVSDISRDIDTMLSETREALRLSGAEEPYILIPHSMSGLEALRWAQLYPNEVMGIVGIDMSIPSAYEVTDNPSFQLKILRILAIIGIQRFLIAGNLSLTTEEYAQAKLLFFRNTLNKTMKNESDKVFANAKTVKESDIPDIPMLLLVSDGIEVGSYWIRCQKEFADQYNARIEFFNCGHYIHQYEPERAADLCREFISDFENSR